MNFELRPAHTLSGPRVYSTDFHPRSTYATDNVALERSLKVKLLTKGIVTLNGGHLLTPAAFSFVCKHPNLLTDGLLLPAIREDKGNFNAYVADNEQAYRSAGWSSNQIDNAVAFLEESVKTVLPWRVEQAQEEYRGRLIWGVSSNTSILRQRLLKLDGIEEATLDKLADELARADLREDSVIDGMLADLRSDAREMVTKFTGAAYHQVGTSVVNCETGLDVSELADRRFGAMAGSQAYDDAHLLSDVSVFIGCCFESAMQAINESAFPTHVIDALSFDVIGKMRVRLQEQGFQQAYDDVISTFGAQLQQSRVEDLENWEPESTVELVAKLSGHFRAYFDEELKNYRKAIQENRQKDAIRAAVATMKSGGSSIPAISEIASVIDTVGSGVEALRAGGEAFAFLNHDTANDAARKERDGRIDSALEAISPRNKAKILTALRQIRTIASEIHRPF